MVKQDMTAEFGRTCHIPQKGRKIIRHVIAAQLHELLVIPKSPILASHFMAVHYHTVRLESAGRQAVYYDGGKIVPLKPSRIFEQFVALQAHLPRTTMLGMTTSGSLRNSEHNPTSVSSRCRPIQLPVLPETTANINYPRRINHLIRTIFRSASKDRVITVKPCKVLPFIGHGSGRQHHSTQLKVSSALSVRPVPPFQIYTEPSSCHGFKSDGLLGKMQMVHSRDIPDLPKMHTVIRNLQTAYRREINIPVTIKGITWRPRHIHCSGRMLGSIVFTVSQRTGGERAAKIEHETSVGIEPFRCAYQNFFFPQNILRLGERQHTYIPIFP